jgi:hypothetical protein
MPRPLPSKFNYSSSICHPTMLHYTEHILTLFLLITLPYRERNGSSLLSTVTNISLRSQARNAFLLLNRGSVGSIPTADMNVYLPSFLFMLFCVGSSLATGWSLVQGALPTACKLRTFRRILSRNSPGALIREGRRMGPLPECTVASNCYGDVQVLLQNLKLCSLLRRLKFIF